MSFTQAFMDTNFTATIINDDGEFYLVQQMQGGTYLAIKKSDVPTEIPPDLDSLPVYLIRESDDE